MNNPNLKTNPKSRKRWFPPLSCFLFHCPTCFHAELRPTSYPQNASSCRFCLALRFHAEGLTHGPSKYLPPTHLCPVCLYIPLASDRDKEAHLLPQKGEKPQGKKK
jgi:hypothetical protein